MNPTTRYFRWLRRFAIKMEDRFAVRDSYETPRHGWTCFHCGETFKSHDLARDHFGRDPDYGPACVLKSERGLLSHLRHHEEAVEKIWNILRDLGER